MLFLPIPSNHRVWSRFNFQLRLAHFHFYEWVGIRHKCQISALLELLPPRSIHYCWRWSESLKEHHTPKWLESELTVDAEVIGRVCAHLTIVYAAPFIHKAMKRNDQTPIVKHGELRSGYESRLRIACDDFRSLSAEKQPTVYGDGRLDEPPEWMLLSGDRGLERRFANAAGLVASVIGLGRADDPDRDGLFLWLDFVSQEPDNGYSLSYEIEEWRDQEPVVTIEGQFTKTGVVELSLRVATRLHYEVMGLADTQAASASESESLRRTFPGVVEKKPLRKAYKQEVEAYKSKKQFHSDEALGAHLGISRSCVTTLKNGDPTRLSEAKRAAALLKILVRNHPDREGLKKLATES